MVLDKIYLSEGTITYIQPLLKHKQKYIKKKSSKILSTMHIFISYYPHYVIKTVH